MSKFERIRGENLDINVSPSGWRRPWIIRWFPYVAGDTATLRIDIKKLPDNVQHLFIRWECRSQDMRPFKTDSDMLAVTSGIHTITTLPIKQPFPNPGHFLAKVILVRENAHSEPSRFGSIVEVRTNFTILCGIMGAILTVGIPLELLRWFVWS